MKTNLIQKWSLMLAVAGLIVFAANSHAQNTPTATAAPQLPGPAAEVLKLAQAKVDDNTIVAYIANSKASYSLTADQIIYLKQQGVSTASLNAMLNRPNTGSAPAPASQPTVAAPAASSTVTVAPPTTTVVQTVPTTTYYYEPYYYPTYYPAYYGWGGPAISFSWGWRGGGWGGWHGGGSGWHGGGGFHGGGGWHGGGHR